MTEDEVFLKQVESLAHTARNAIEEASTYAERIQDPELKKQAEQILETIP